MKQYIVRLDDISWDMNYENFIKIKKLLIKYNVKPVIGIIPNNKDLSLKEYTGVKMEKEHFWNEVKELQSQNGWSVALHGYDHVYVTDNGGLFNINPRAEFAGLPYEIQNEKIRKGKKILEDESIRIDAFMAPGHSLDWVTVRALLDNGISVVTDGIAYYPYKEKGMQFIPQTSPWFRKGAFGVETVCFHINSWRDEQFDKLDLFLKNNSNKCVGFSEIVSQADFYDKHVYVALNSLAKIVIPLKSKFRRGASIILSNMRKE